MFFNKMVFVSLDYTFRFVSKFEVNESEADLI